MPTTHPAQIKPLPRREIIAFAIIAAVAASLLIFGVNVARLPVAFVVLSGASGSLFSLSLLWGLRRQRYPLVSAVALNFFIIVFEALRRGFFGNFPEPFWPIFAAQLGSFMLGAVSFFPAISRATKSNRLQSD